MKINRDNLVLDRVARQTPFEDHRRVLHNLRRVVLGDFSQFGIGSKQDARDVRDSLDFSEYPDIHRIDIPEGYTNKLYEHCKTLVEQTAFRMPQFRFPAAPREVEAIHQAYLMQILGEDPGCRFIAQARKAMWDFVIGGIGWLQLRYSDKGKPIVSYCSALDVTWDQGYAVDDIQWVSVKRRAPFWQLIEEYGEAAFQHRLSGRMNVADYERQVTLEYYFDVGFRSEPGRYYVIDPKQGRDQKSSIVAMGENPYMLAQIDEEGFEDEPVRYFLPVVGFAYQQLPSGRFPSGPVEHMLPGQILLLRQEQNMMLRMKRGVPNYAVRKGTFDREDMEKFLSGEVGQVLEMNENGALPVVFGEMGITELDLAIRNMALEQMQGQSGANPYAAGTVPNADFAAEVVAREQQARLTSGAIAAAYTAFVSGVIQKVLHLGALYDGCYYRLMLEGQRVKVGGENPIGAFLDPHEPVEIAESSGQFMTQRERVLQLSQDIQLVAQFGDKYPKAVDYYMKMLLEANGVSDPDALLEAPAPATMPMGGEGVDPVMLEQVIGGGALASA